MSGAPSKPAARLWSKRFTYDDWMEAQNVPIYRGYYIADLRTMELGWWALGGCNAAFIQLTGQEGVTSTRVVEIPPGKSIGMGPFAFDEIAYVLSGTGATKPADGKKQSFEWQPTSMFLIPRGQASQFSNLDGAAPARLMFFNYLPMAMSVVPDADFYFRNLPHADGAADDFYAEARMVKPNDVGDGAYLGKRIYWHGAFFASMKDWDKMASNAHRGAGSTSVYCQFPDTELSAHMSEFGAGTYKKAHRHGPGRAIVIPKGEGYSIMWEEGKDKVIIPWQEGSLFVPPDRWFHQHFNTSAEPSRYLALHPPMQFHGHAEKVTDRARDQIEYVDEDPAIRRRFEAELAKKGLTSRLDPKVYTERDFDWAKFAVEVHGSGAR